MHENRLCRVQVMRWAAYVLISEPPLTPLQGRKVALKEFGGEKWKRKLD